ncbi:hypothetical protein [Deinococcus navajonensis]|uniref:Uncharacterized protein n=1 Tax=Deinococcus navajonensis TaxID=309884 RepID=A0ABV8XRB3_9DEIO
MKRPPSPAQLPRSPTQSLDAPPVRVEAWVDMAHVNLTGSGPETSWGLVWRETGPDRPARVGRAGGSLERESELLAVQLAAEHLAQQGWAGTVTLYCDDILTVRRLGGLTERPGQEAQSVRERLTALGTSIKHIDRERTAARAAHQQARLMLSTLTHWPRNLRAMRSEAEVELPRLLAAVARGEEASQARFQKSGLVVQVAVHAEGGPQRETLSVSVQKGTRQTVVLWEGESDQAPELIRRIAAEVEDAERVRVAERHSRRPLPGAPEELREAVVGLLAEGGTDGMPVSHVCRLLHGVEAAVLRQAAATWPEVQLTEHAGASWLRLSLHPQRSAPRSGDPAS